MTTRGDDGVYLHIGVPKTGTTYLQSFLWSNREALEARGLLFAADHPAAHYSAVIDLRGGTFIGNEVVGASGAWERVATEAVAWPRRSLISHELFGGLRRSGVQRVFDAVGTRPVHVVLTLRDLARIVPATWQEVTKNQRIEAWDDYLERIRPKRKRRRDPRFWHLQNVPRILKVWAAHVPAERIHVVTVPPPGAPRTLLVDRFLSVFGVDSAGLDLDVSVANESIGAAEVALLRRVNMASQDKLSWDTYHDYVKHFAVPRILAARADSTRITTPDTELPWLRAETERTRSSIRKLGCDVVGDLDDLNPRTAGDAYVDPSTVADEDVLDAAVDLVIGLVDRYATLDRSTKSAVLMTDVFRGVRRGRFAEARTALGRGVDAYRRARRQDS